MTVSRRYWPNAFMPAQIAIRDVPEEVRDELAAVSDSESSLRVQGPATIPGNFSTHDSVARPVRIEELRDLRSFCSFSHLPPELFPHLSPFGRVQFPLHSFSAHSQQRPVKISWDTLSFAQTGNRIEIRLAK